MIRGIGPAHGPPTFSPGGHCRRLRSSICSPAAAPGWPEPRTSTAGAQHSLPAKPGRSRASSRRPSCARRFPSAAAVFTRLCCCHSLRITPRVSRSSPRSVRLGNRQRPNHQNGSRLGQGRPKPHRAVGERRKPRAAGSRTACSERKWRQGDTAGVGEHLGSFWKVITGRPLCHRPASGTPACERSAFEQAKKCLRDLWDRRRPRDSRDTPGRQRSGRDAWWRDHRRPGTSAPHQCAGSWASRWSVRRWPWPPARGPLRRRHAGPSVSCPGRSGSVRRGRRWPIESDSQRHRNCRVGEGSPTALR